jgi:hypothetical protein
VSPRIIGQMLAIVLAAIRSASCSSPSQSKNDASSSGTYEVAVQASGLFGSRTRARGVLVLVDTVLHTRARYFMSWHPYNGCLNLEGNLALIGFDRAGFHVTGDSVPLLVAWWPDSTGARRLSLYQGVDYGYSVQFSVSQAKLQGSGVYYGMGAVGGSNRSRWNGRRLGEPNTKLCYSALRQDSLLARRDSIVAARTRR